MIELNLNEVFDEDSQMLPVTNLYPKTKIPQIFAIAAPEGSVALRMCSYTGGGDVNKNVKPGDKMIHAIVLGMSDKGTLVKLKNLGGDPLGVISTMFDLVSQTVKKYKMDAVMFRIAKSKMGGQARAVQTIINRLVLSRLGGRFVILKELYDYDKKYVYVLIHRKNVDLSTIPGIPEISKEVFTKVDTDVGDVYVDVKTGKQVSKSEAIAATIAQENDKRTDNAVIARTKVSRRSIAQSQSLSSDKLNSADFEKYESTAAEFSKPAIAAEIPEAEQLKNAMTSNATIMSVSKRMGRYILQKVQSYTDMRTANPTPVEKAYAEELYKVIEGKSLTSIDTLKSFADFMLKQYEANKETFFIKQKAVIQATMRHGDFANEAEIDAAVERMWITDRSNYLKESMRLFADVASRQINEITEARTPKQYSAAEKRGIREYVGSGYSDINDTLLGRYDPQKYNTLKKDEVTKAITNLDAAFKKGDRLPEGITLWRSQSIRLPIFEALRKNRVFYFRNYVSTSLAPIIFGGWRGNSFAAFAPDDQRKLINLPGGFDSEEIVPDPNQEHLPEIAPEKIRVIVGWAIDGAHKINVVYPGDLSNISSEMEVILPRGTMLKISKIVDSSYTDTTVRYGNQKFIQAEVMTSDQLDESTVVYDGDVLMETGELVEYDEEVAEEPSSYSFGEFLKSTKESESTEILSTLASLISIDDLPQRFVE